MLNPLQDSVCSMNLSRQSTLITARYSSITKTESYMPVRHGTTIFRWEMLTKKEPPLITQPPNPTACIAAKSTFINGYTVDTDFLMKSARCILKTGIILTASAPTGGMIDYLHTTYARFINRNFKTAGWNVAAYYKNLNKVPFSTYSQNADYFKNWCSDRAEGLNSYYTEDVVEYALGDSDSNGSLDIMDATAIQRYLAQYGLKRYYPTAADVNGNGIADILDATGIQRYLAGYSSTIAFEKIMFGKTE